MQKRNKIKQAKKKRILRNAGAAVLSTLLVVAMLVGLFPGNETQAAESAIADDATADNWAQLNYNVEEGRTTKNDGRIWTDKSVYTGNASVLKNQKDNIEITKSEDSDFLVGLSTLSSTMKVEGISEKPLDIIMVLDVSGSMNKGMEYEKVYSGNLSYRDTYYIMVDNDYQEITYSYDYRSWYYYQNNRIRWVQPKGNENSTQGEQFYKIKESKMDVLADSVKNFVEITKETNEKAISSEKQHRISVVKFSGNIEESTGNDIYTHNDNGTWNTYNYSQVVKEFVTPVDDTTVADLNNAVDGLAPAGATRADNGLKVAEDVMEGVRTNAQPVVIFFTDGIPTKFNTWDNSVANGAIGYAKNMKDAGAWVYSVGVFDETDLANNENLVNYMQAVSSNYPKATGFTQQSMGQGDADGAYYNIAENAEELRNIFDNIAHEISGKPAELPTHVEMGYDADKDGYVTFVDTLGDYMEVSAVKSVVYEGEEYENQITAEAWNGAVSDTNVYKNNSIVTNDLDVNVSIDSVIVTITRAEDARTGDIITVKVPAALVPLAYYNVTVTDAGAVTERIPTTPIRVFYEVSIKDGVSDLLENPDTDMREYLETHVDSDGNAIFYSNAYDEKTNAEIGSTVASFKPSTMNDMYYAVDDTLIYADEECTEPVTRSINESATYYYKRVYYVVSEDPISPEYEIVSFSASVLKDVDYAFNDDGQLYVKAGEGRYTRADATDTVKADGANKTSTATNAAAPRWEKWNEENSEVPVHLGNNGLLKVAVPGTLAISKTVVVPEWSIVNVDEKEFDFIVTLKDANDKTLAGTYKVQKKDAEGNNIGNASTIKTDKDGHASVKLKDGETLFIYGLPAGTGYTVYEEYREDGFYQTAPVDDSGQAQSVNGTIEAGKISTAAFENTYKPTGKLEGKAYLKGSKILSGDREWRDEDVFAFALIPEDANNPMPYDADAINGTYMALTTVKGTDTDKEFYFGDIIYTEQGTYLYDIREIVIDGVADRVPGISYSQVVYKVKVTVTDNGNGELGVSSEMKPFGEGERVDSAEFENTYIEDTVEFAFKGIKELNNTTGAYKLKDDTFSFQLIPVTDNAPMPRDTVDNVYTTTNKGATISFGSIEHKMSQESFTAPGEKVTYEYKVKELLPNNVEDENPEKEGIQLNGITYDETEYSISVEFTWDETDGLLFNIVYPDADGDETTKETWVTFTNIYDPEDVEVELEGLKILTGRDEWTENDKFTFVLKGQDNAPMPEGSQGSEYTFHVDKENETSKLGVFGVFITYDQPGTYKYTLSEVTGNAGGMTYDDYVSNITVTVSDDGNGKLTAVKNVEARTDIEVKTGVSGFVNKYEAEMTYPGLTVEKTLYGRDMTFGEFDFRIEAENDNARNKGLAETDSSFESGAHLDGETCKMSGKLSSLVFTQKDAGKEFIYKVSEILPADDDDIHYGVQKDGVTYDKSEYWVVIVPADNADGTMNVTTKIYNGDPSEEGTRLVGLYSSKEEVPIVAFKNEYGFADVTVETGANALFTKIFEGREWLESDTFTFKMSVAEDSAENTPMPENAKDGVVTVTVSKPVSGNSAVVDFGSITFTEPGTYKYNVTELDGKISNVIYDRHSATLTVNVVDNDRGKLVASTVVTDGQFKNVYEDVVTYGDVTSLDVTKSLEGRELRERQFEFKVIPQDIPSMRKAGMTTLEGITFRNGAPGSDGKSHMFSPDEMRFSQDDLDITYSYLFYEINGGTEGYSYDPNQYKLEMVATYNADEARIEVTTKVTDQDGRVIADKTSYEGVEEKPVVTIAFENEYEADATSQKAEGTKAMVNRDLVANEFEFVLAYAADADKTPIATVSNNTEGKVVFAEQTYTLESLNKLVNDGFATKAVDGMTDTYTINYVAFEKAGDSDSITHTESTFAFTVTVTDDGTGKLTSEIEYPESGLAFKNEYKSAPINYNVKGLKILQSEDGLTPASIEGKFSFELKAVTANAPMPEKTKVTNDAHGNVDFGAIEFKLSDLEGVEQDGKARTKTFEYSVTETGSAPGVTNDSDTTKTFTITVTDDGEGNLTAVANPAEGPLFSFTNTYKAGNVTESITGSGNLVITKKLEGREMKAGEFKFELVEVANEEENVVAEGTNTKDGTVKFETVTYDVPGRHIYVIREVKGEAGGVTYDEKTYQVEANVTDNGKGKLEVEFAVISEGVENIVFNNTYKPKETTLSVAPGKKLEGRELKDGEFKFQITALAEDAPMPESEIVTNDEDGKICFGAITYDKAGVWEYKLSEVKGDDTHIEYDSKVYNMEVVVTDDGVGNLTAKATFDGEETAPTFVNTYTADPVGVQFSVNKTLVGDSDKEFIFQLYETKNDFAVSSDKLIDETAVQVRKDKAEAVFETITFDKTGEYFYTIIEDIPVDTDGIVYDRTHHNYKVTVNDNGNGYLETVIDCVTANATCSGNSVGGEPVKPMPAVFKNATSDEVAEKEVYLDSDRITNIDGKKVDEGSILTYFITYTNYSGEDVTVDIEDKIPEHTTYVEDSASDNGVYAAGSVKWQLQLRRGESVTVHFQVKVDETEVIVANKANINDGINTYTTNEVKNHTIEEITEKDVYSPEDLSVSIDGKKVYEGDELYYEVSFINASNDKVDVTITDEIPEYTTYIDKSADNNGVYADGKLTWEIKEIAPWETVKVGFKVKVNADIEAVTIENEAKVVEGKNTYTTNEVTNYTVEDETEKDVALADKPNASIDGKEVKKGDEILYTIEYKNTAKESVNVQITDNVPQYTTYVEGSADNGGVYENGVISWDLEVPAGETVKVSFKVTVDDVYAETIENEAKVVEGKNEYTTNEVTNTKVNELDVFIAIQKMLEVKEDAEHTLGGFEFELSNVTDSENVVTFDKAISDNEGNTGYILQFDDKDLNKTYKFELIEINQGAEGMTYDTTVHEIEIKLVVDSETGKLVAEITQDGVAVDEAKVVFNNIYEGEESEPDEPKDPGKIVETNPTKTGDNTTIITYLFALLASLLAAFIALIVRRRNSYRR